MKEIPTYLFLGLRIFSLLFPLKGESSAIWRSKLVSGSLIPKSILNEHSGYFEPFSAFFFASNWVISELFFQSLWSSGTKITRSSLNSRGGADSVVSNFCEAEWNASSPLTKATFVPLALKIIFPSSCLMWPTESVMFLANSAGFALILLMALRSSSTKFSVDFAAFFFFFAPLTLLSSILDPSCLLWLTVSFIFD